MSLNKFMHPRNRYKTARPDFGALGQKYPEFKIHLTDNAKGKPVLDFQDPEALKALTICMLKEDYDLKIDLPPDRLVPTLPLRLNYIHWVEDITRDWNKQKLHGIDIGTGACCIYPVLAISENPWWRFLATEADDINFSYAVKNLEENKLTDKIQVKNVSQDIILEGVIGQAEDTYDFCMCNPPFFADHMEAQGLVSRSPSRPEAKTMSTASPQECIVQGGEVAFVRRLIEESNFLQDKVRVYSTMLGKKTSLAPLKEILRRYKIINFASTEFCQGKTMRWGLAWSFDESVTFPKSQFSQVKKEGKKSVVHVIPTPVGGRREKVYDLVSFFKQLFSQLKIHFREGKQTQFFALLTLTAAENTWIHTRRKRRQIMRETGRSDAVVSESSTAESVTRTSQTSTGAVVTAGESENTGTSSVEKPQLVDVTEAINKDAEKKSDNSSVSKSCDNTSVTESRDSLSVAAKDDTCDSTNRKDSSKMAAAASDVTNFVRHETCDENVVGSVQSKSCTGIDNNKRKADTEETEASVSTKRAKLDTDSPQSANVKGAGRVDKPSNCLQVNVERTESDIAGSSESYKEEGSNSPPTKRVKLEGQSPLSTDSRVCEGENESPNVSSAKRKISDSPTTTSSERDQGSHSPSAKRFKSVLISQSSALELSTEETKSVKELKSEPHAQWSTETCKDEDDDSVEKVKAEADYGAPSIKVCEDDSNLKSLSSSTTTQVCREQNKTSANSETSKSSNSSTITQVCTDGKTADSVTPKSLGSFSENETSENSLALFAITGDGTENETAAQSVTPVSDACQERGETGSPPPKRVKLDSASCTSNETTTNNTTATTQKSPSVKTHTQPSTEDIQNADTPKGQGRPPAHFILKCHMCVRVQGSDLAVELTWLGGEDIQLMHQLMQFFKNRLAQRNP